MSYLGVPPFGQTVRTVTTITATASQTTFTPIGGYTVGYCDVFYNGVKLVAGSDFTASDGLTVVLTVGATSGAVVEIITYGSVTITDAVRRSGDTFAGAVAFSANTSHTGAATFANTITVAGNVTFSNTTAHTGDATFSSNVGVGTSSPGFSLDVQRNANDSLSRINVQNANTGSSAVGILGLGNDQSTTVSGLKQGSSTWSTAGSGLELFNNVGPTLLSTSGTERVRIDASGNIGIGGTASRGILDIFSGRVNIRGNSSDSRAFVTMGDAAYTNATIAAAYGGDLTLTGAPIILTQGQLKFPATQNASSDGNTLDDYEYGTFTPSLTFGGGSTGMTYGARNAQYVKIGKQVTVWVYFNLSSKGSSTGAAYIQNLPFTNINYGGSAEGATVVANYWANFAGSYIPNGYVQNNQSQWIFVNTVPGTTTVGMDNTYFTNSTIWYGVATYRASA
jgi:hypothetical protein